jgi:hypothetical protein
MLARLPESYDTMRRILESNEDLTVLKVSTEFNKEATRRSKKRKERALLGEARPARPFKKQRINDTCVYCERKGHKAEQCWLNPDSKDFKQSLVDKLAVQFKKSTAAREQQE